MDQRVRLVADIPEYELRSGDEGIVCSRWFSPQSAYEIEFETVTGFCKTRALLSAEQFQAVTSD